MAKHGKNYREAIKDINQDYKTKFGFNDPETGYVYKAPKGLSRQLVEDIWDTIAEVPDEVGLEARAFTPRRADTRRGSLCRA